MIVYLEKNLKYFLDFEKTVACSYIHIHKDDDNNNNNIKKYLT
jgi:hypothetical protein